MPSAIVPAAGSATRFGSAKLAAPLNGRLLLDQTISSLLDGGVSEVIVVLPPESDWTSAVATLQDRRVKTAINPEPSRGMLSSIQIGARVAAESPLVVLPADMPFVTPETVRELLATASRTGRIVSPAYQSRRGHPVILPADLRPVLLAAASETQSLKDVLLPYADRFTNVPVSDPGVLRDVDLKEDLPS